MQQLPAAASDGSGAERADPRAVGGDDPGSRVQDTRQRVNEFLGEFEAASILDR